jgi:hypothetical protein
VTPRGRIRPSPWPMVAQMGNDREARVHGTAGRVRPRKSAPLSRPRRPPCAAGR